jgi:vacuolar-type H+-ATPase subunit E/Vma4
MSKREQEVNTSPSQIQKEQQETVNRALDQARDNIKKTVNEARKDVSMYSEQFTNLQERAIETTRNIAETYIESQREIFNSFNQSVWTPYVEQVANRAIALHEAFSSPRAEAYANTVGSMVDNFVTATRTMNKTVFANAGLINTSLQQASDNAREYSRIGINAAKNIHETANEISKIGMCVVEQTSATRRS